MEGEEDAGNFVCACMYGVMQASKATKTKQDLKQIDK